MAEEEGINKNKRVIDDEGGCGGGWWWWFEANPNHHCESWDGLAHHHFRSPSHKLHNCPSHTHNAPFVGQNALVPAKTPQKPSSFLWRYVHHHRTKNIKIFRLLSLRSRLPCLHMHDCCVRERGACPPHPMRLSLVHSLSNFSSPLSDVLLYKFTLSLTSLHKLFLFTATSC